MNDISALETKGRAELAASGMNALTGGSFGSDFAVLLTQMSDTGEKGLAGALSSFEVQKGIAGAPQSLSKDKRRARTDGQSAASQNKQTDPLASPGVSDNGAKSADKSQRADHDHAGRSGNLKSDENDQQRIMSRDHNEKARSSDDNLARTDSSDEDAETGSDKADAQRELSVLNENDADLAMPLTIRGSESDGELSLTDEDGSSDALLKNASALSDEMSEEDSDAGMLKQMVSTSSRDAAGGAETAITKNAALSGNFSENSNLSDLKQEASAQATLDTQTDLSALGSDEPEKVQTLSADGQALGELMSDAGVTKVSSTKPQFPDAGDEASDISDSLSNIADSIKAASELLPEQDQGGENSAGQDQSDQSMKDALMVLRQGSKGSGSADGSAQNAEGLLAEGDLAEGEGGLKAQDQAGQRAGVAQSLTMAQSEGKVSAAPAESAMYEPSSAVTGGNDTLSASRLNARDSFQTQSLRDSMLSLSSDVKANAEKITQAVMAMSAKNLKSLHIELNPEGLGSMQIDIDSDSKDEAVRIGISASSSQARAILSQGMDALREGLMRNGIFAQAELSSGTDSGTASSDGGNSGSGQWQGSENNRQWRGADGSAIFASAPEESADPAIASSAETDDGALNLFA
ncbi:MAG: flagellar hook-length control protein FliK [Succinatimonas hippei]|nr:flagellar hook-length control protein FliK [Succinatimonas hippei]